MVILNKNLLKLARSRVYQTQLTRPFGHRRLNINIVFRIIELANTSYSFWLQPSSDVNWTDPRGVLQSFVSRKLDGFQTDAVRETITGNSTSQWRTPCNTQFIRYFSKPNPFFAYRIFHILLSTAIRNNNNNNDATRKTVIKNFFFNSSTYF